MKTLITALVLAMPLAGFAQTAEKTAADAKASASKDIFNNTVELSMFFDIVENI
jgi:hypothetical protein